jgi:hypothetical protein
MSAASGLAIEHYVHVITIASKVPPANGKCSADARSSDTGVSASATCRVRDREQRSEPLPGYRETVQPGLKNQTSC